MKQQTHRQTKRVKANKRKKLDASGWSVGSTREFLGLSDEEAAFVELKLSANPKQYRTSQGLSQSESAKLARAKHDMLIRSAVHEEGGATFIVSDDEDIV
jgi:hypothetical protein